MATAGGGDGILGIDTATADAAVAVVAGGELVDERRADPDAAGRPRHATLLLAEVEAARGGGGRLGADRRDRRGRRPGRVHGLAVGIATARALGAGSGACRSPVGSLAALARGIGERRRRRRRALAAIDARRGQAFAALYDPPGEPLAAAGGGTGGAGRAPGGRPAGRWAGGDGALRFRRCWSPRARRSSQRGTRRTGWRLVMFARWPRGSSPGRRRDQARLSEKARCRGMA